LLITCVLSIVARGQNAYASDSIVTIIDLQLDYDGARSDFRSFDAGDTAILRDQITSIEFDYNVFNSPITTLYFPARSLPSVRDLESGRAQPESWFQWNRESRSTFSFFPNKHIDGDPTHYPEVGIPVRGDVRSVFAVGEVVEITIHFMHGASLSPYRYGETVREFTYAVTAEDVQTSTFTQPWQYFLLPLIAVPLGLYALKRRARPQIQDVQSENYLQALAHAPRENIESSDESARMYLQTTLGNAPHRVLTNPAYLSYAKTILYRTRINELEKTRNKTSEQLSEMLSLLIQETDALHTYLELMNQHPEWDDLRYLHRLGLYPGAQITLQKRIADNNSQVDELQGRSTRTSDSNRMMRG
jgi:hypothetical protein